MQALANTAWAFATACEPVPDLFDPIFVLEATEQFPENLPCALECPIVPLKGLIGFNRF